MLIPEISNLLMLDRKSLFRTSMDPGHFAKKWDRSGLVVEDLGHNKYRIKIDGSGRVTE